MSATTVKSAGALNVARRWTVRVSAVLSAAAVVVAGLAGSSPASAGTGYRLVSRISVDREYALDVLNHDTANGAPVALWQWNGGPNQYWNIKSITENNQVAVVQFVNIESGKCLSTDSSGATLIQQPCDGTEADQLWWVTKTVNGFLTLAQRGACLTAGGPVVVNGSAATLEGCDGTPSQEFNVYQL